MLLNRSGKNNYVRYNGGMVFWNSLRKTLKIQRSITGRFDRLKNCVTPLNILESVGSTSKELEFAANSRTTLNTGKGTALQHRNESERDRDPFLSGLIRAPEKFFFTILMSFSE